MKFKLILGAAFLVIVLILLGTNWLEGAGLVYRIQFPTSLSSIEFIVLFLAMGFSALLITYARKWYKKDKTNDGFSDNLLKAFYLLLLLVPTVFLWWLLFYLALRTPIEG